MKWARRIFRNEFDRDIHIEVGDQMAGTVLIRMQGPESCSTNEVTKTEAENLRDALNEWSAVSLNPTPTEER